MHKFRTALALTMGAGAAYFADRDQGRSRRAKVTEKTRAWSRRRARDADRAARYDAGVQAGEAARARGAGSYHPHGDADLHEHLRMVLANLEVPTSAVTVEVAEGQVRVRGQVSTAAEGIAVIEALGAVPGVDGVESLLHLPGQPAPNKAAALAASATAAPTGPGSSAPSTTPGPTAPH